MLIVLATGFIACAGDGPIKVQAPRQPQWGRGDPDSCKYVRFRVLREPTGGSHAPGSADEAIVQAVEDTFARGMELAGFRPAMGEETPFLFLRTILNTSGLRANAVTGVVHIGAFPNLHRDFSFGVADGAVEIGEIGMMLAVEIATRWNRLDPAANLEELARDKGRWAWGASAPVLSRLCEWNAQLLKDAISVNDVRLELIEEMNQFRKGSERRKELHLDVEK